jgi:hypothetical protein
MECVIQNIQKLKADYKALRSRCASGQCSSSQQAKQQAAKVKRTSGQAALDDSLCSSSSSPESANVTRPVNTLSNGRIVIPIPKRVKLTTRAAFTEQRSPASSSGEGSSLLESSPSSSSLSTSPACSRNAGPVTSERNVRVTRSRAARGS